MEAQLQEQLGEQQTALSGVQAALEEDPENEELQEVQ